MRMKQFYKGQIIEIKKELAGYLTDIDVYRALKNQVGDFRVLVDTKGIYIELV